jgi:hypothetical protein
VKKKLLVISLISGLALSNLLSQEGTGNRLTINTRLTLNNYVRDIVNHPAFKGFGERMLSRDNNAADYDTRLSNDTGRLPYPQTVAPGIVVNALNHLIDEVKAGKTVFYDFYTSQKKQHDRQKRMPACSFLEENPARLLR